MKGQNKDGGVQLPGTGLTLMLQPVRQCGVGEGTNRLREQSGEKSRQLIPSKGAKQYNGEKTSFQKMVLEQLGSHVQKRKKNP